MSRISAKRLTKELTELQTNGPPTGKLLSSSDQLLAEPSSSQPPLEQVASS